VKAVVFDNYGPPEILKVTDLEKPAARSREVVIKVHATTVTHADGMMRRGDTAAARIFLGLRKPRKRFRIMGIELAGVIEAVGRDVTLFKPGDEVYGFRGFGTGTCAEYKSMPETGSLELKPSNLDFHEAASVVDGSTTALYFLRDLGKIKKGQKVLINGASGSIGVFAVQLAAWFGAEVTGVCSAANGELVKSLGAGHIIDYTREDFTRSGKTWDIIFDTVGKSSFTRCRKALSPKGRYLVTNGNIIKNRILTLLTPLSGGKRFVWGMSVEKKDPLRFLKDLFETDKLKPVIDRVYPLEQVIDAHRYVETGHKKGNVVIRI
jgi:NADPH2:quinone reductase